MQEQVIGGDLARIRRVMAFAEATQAPPEALAWLLRLSREAEARRAAGAKDVQPLSTIDVLADPTLASAADR